MSGIEPIDLRELDKTVANAYEGIVVASKRARQINDENKIEFQALISTIPVSTTDDDAEDIQNPAQLKIALEHEKKDKPHIQAIKEVMSGKVQFDYKK